MESKEEKKRPKLHRDWHHVFPTSRFKIKKPIKQHRAWHKLFPDLTPVEAIMKIQSQWIDYGGKIDFGRMTQEEEENWSIVFSNVEAFTEAVELINSEWTIPGLKIIFELEYVKQKTKSMVS